MHQNDLCKVQQTTSSFYFLFFFKRATKTKGETPGFSFQSPAEHKRTSHYEGGLCHTGLQ